MSGLEKLFCSMDDCCQIFEPVWDQELSQDSRSLDFASVVICLSEILTILISFHREFYRNFESVK
jgi:hypothetical protein